MKSLVVVGILSALIASVSQAQATRNADEPEGPSLAPAAKKKGSPVKKQTMTKSRRSRARSTTARTARNTAPEAAVGPISAYRAPNDNGLSATTLQPGAVNVNANFGGFYGGYGYGLNGGYYGGNYGYAGYGLNLGAVGGSNGNLAPGNLRSNANNAAVPTGVTSGPVLNNRLGYQAAGGQFVPGYGVNNGFAAPTQVYGGTYVSGYGVNNGFAAPVQLYGGTYVPGYGVNNGFARPEAVVGGWYTPGYGVQSGVFGGSTGGGGTAVQGGTLVPGMGVVSGIR